MKVEDIGTERCRQGEFATPPGLTPPGPQSRAPAETSGLGSCEAVGNAGPGRLPRDGLSRATAKGWPRPVTVARKPLRPVQAPTVPDAATSDNARAMRCRRTGGLPRTRPPPNVG